MRKKRTNQITKKLVQGTENLPVPNVHVKPEIDEESWGNDCMTFKQRLFVRFYVGEAAGNATKAARMAGYKDDNAASLTQTAHDTLIKPYVQRAIEQELGKRFGSPEEVRNSIRAIANSNAADYMERGLDGKLRPNLEKMAEAGSLGMLQQYQGDVEEIGPNVRTTKVKMKLYDRLKALEILAKMNGAIVERHVVTGENGEPIKQEVTHRFDHGRFADLYRRRTAGRDGVSAGVDSADDN